ncbi:hypothetical protein K2X92_05360 [Candidatus Gracilibacteria bacterium]|nr:hypothetical protein [Candidatus Gracilibacteria bacterium]
MAILLVENSAGKPFDGCPIKINEIGFTVISSKGIFDLQKLIGKRIRSIEANGARKTLNPEVLIQKGTQLRIRHLMNGLLDFQDETSELID